MDDEAPRRWRIKKSIFSQWVELPGEHTATQIWNLKQKGDFAVAMPIEDNGMPNPPSPDSA